MEQKSFTGTDSDPVTAPSGEEKTMALLSHILTLVAGFLAPLIIYLVKRIPEFSNNNVHYSDRTFYYYYRDFACMAGRYFFIGVRHYCNNKNQ